MGFAREGCRKAVYHTHNSGAEAAMAWIFEHMGDADFSDPLTLVSKTSSTASKVCQLIVVSSLCYFSSFYLQEASYDEDSIVMLTSMGFTRDQALLGLKSTVCNFSLSVYSQKSNSPFTEWEFRKSSRLALQPCT